MVQNIISHLTKKGNKPGEVVVILDNSEYTITNVTRVLDKVQLTVEKVIPTDSEEVEGVDQEVETQEEEDHE
jgi:bifunctional N-acetylglucosamine-1-phosphate-uridyltransferase/glucosamine-1-phosphate-acetyltransferase GlmU-like protein